MKCRHEAEGFQQGSFQEAATAAPLSEKEQCHLRELQNVHLILGGRGWSWKRYIRKAVGNLWLETLARNTDFRSRELSCAVT